MLVVFGLRAVGTGDSANSRLATVWALVHEGTWAIDRPIDGPPNPFAARTVDKVQIEGRMYSTKPPLLPLAMTAEYYVLHHAFGLRLDDAGDFWFILRFMVFSLVGAPYLLMLLFFVKNLQLYLDRPGDRALPLFALAFATQLPGFSVTINNHVPGACMLMIALYYAGAVLRDGGGRRSFALFGVAGGLVFTLDMPLTVFVAAAGLFLLYRCPRTALAYGGAGMMAPLLLHFCVMWAATGSLLPIQMREELYFYEGAYWRNPSGLDALNNPPLWYLFHMTFGRFGSFTLFPVLIAAAPVLAYALFRRGMAHRAQVLAAGAAFSILTLYYVLKTNNYGGAAYGFRWYIGAMPVLLLVGSPLLSWRGGAMRRVVLVLALLISLYSSFEAFNTPWGAHQEWTCRWVFGPSY